MPNTIHDKGAGFQARRSHQKKLYSWFAALALVVVAGTLWMLVRPANTLSGQLICGIEAHSHSDECYASQLVCGQEEGETHTHTEECREEVPVCPKPEHVHSEACYDVTEPVPDEESQMSEEQAAQPEPLRHAIPADYTEVRTAQLPGGGAVNVFAQPGVIPESVTLRVQAVEETGEVYALAEQRVKAAGVDFDYLTALDLALVDETGVEVEPSAPVYVSMDVEALLPEKADPKTIRIQHHKELPPAEPTGLDSNADGSAADMPGVVVESVLDDTVGTRKQPEHTVTFLTEGFSIYTVTSSGWPTLKIRIQCVDEFGRELPDTDRPEQDVVFDERYAEDASFDILFMTGKPGETHAQVIEGYEYEGHAYFMRGGEYERRIYGIRRENGEWYYHTKDNDRNSKNKFDPQPDFIMNEKQDPPDFIRLIYKKVSDIPVQYVHDPEQSDGKEVLLSDEDTPNRKNPDTITYTGSVLDTSDAAAMPSSKTYFYAGKAYLGDLSESNDVVRVIREEGILYGVTPEGEKLPISEESPLKLVYQGIQHGTPNVVDTASTREKGMTIHLFDYNSDGPSSINNNHQLQFIGGGVGSQNKEYNRWTGKNGGIYTGIVAPELGPDGYPTVEGESLAYLFDPVKCKEQMSTGEVRHVHTNLDGLFQLDRDGYYYYDSTKNFATIMDSNPSTGDGGHNPEQTDEETFTVYQQAALPGLGGAKFLPFNSYAEANQRGNANKNYHFGMTMEADFVMPPGGKVPDASGAHTGLRDMIFEFNGDDDVWVFIDNKLVLDLGGVHGRYGGTINFRTGEVTTNAPPALNSGWRQKNLYGIDNPGALTDDQLKEDREEAGFGKYTQHNFKFFYLERGKEESNCEIRFNLTPVEHDLLVGKRVSGAADGVVTDHMWYQFQVETEYNGTKQPLANATYRRIQWTPESHPITGGHSIDVGQTNEQGRFWLRAGERADFSGAIDLKKVNPSEGAHVKIYVSEIFPDGTSVQVKAWSGKEEKKGTYLEVPDGNGKVRKVAPPLYYDPLQWPEFHTESRYQPEITTVEAKQDSSDGTRKPLYQAVLESSSQNEFNWIDFENDLGAMATLNITKRAFHSDGVTPLPDVPFAVKVELWDTKDERWIPLPTGSKYWILDPGQTPQTTPQSQLEASANGLISIKDGQTIRLQTLPGTKYRVSEDLSPEDANAYTTTYEGSSDEAGKQLEVWEDAGKQIGIGDTDGMAVGSEHSVTITNKSNPIVQESSALKLSKKVVRTDWPDGSLLPEDRAQRFTFQITLNDTSAFSQDQISAVITGSDGQNTDAVLEFRQEGSGYTAQVELKHGDTLLVSGLPVDGQAVVQELDHAGYVVTMNGAPGDHITVALQDATGDPHEIQCINTTGVKIPETGGTGTLPYILLGTLILSAAGLLLYRQRQKRDRP